MDIYIVGQNEKIAQSLKECSGVNVIDDAVKALTILSDCAGGIVFLNYELLQQQSPVFIRGLSRYNQNLQIIVVADSICDVEIIECVMAGAKGYEEIVSLPNTIDKIIDVIENGEAWLSRRLVARMIEYIVDQNRLR